MSVDRKERIRTLLKGIETGDPSAVAVVDESRYIQHNPQTHEGSEGLAALFRRLAKTSPRVNLVRVFEDGDYVFAHTEYDFASRRIGFEVFRFEGDYAVEHWDNIQPRRGPNPSGHTMVDGPTEAGDRDRTDPNRALIRRFVEDVVIPADRSRMAEFVESSRFVQHDPTLPDDVGAWADWMCGDNAGSPRADYRHCHRILADGAFVLTVCEGFLEGTHTSFYDLFRIDDDRIVERWNTIEAVPPPSDWKNDNGKF